MATRSLPPVHVPAIALALLTALLTACSTGRTEDLSSAPRPTLEPYPLAKRYVVAVMPFQFRAEQERYRGMAEKAGDLMSEALFGTQRFRMIERSRMTEVLGELALNQTGLVDEAGAVKMGRQLGADAIVLGTVVSVQPLRNRDSVGFAHIDESGLEVVLKARVIDMERGELLSAGDAVAREVAEQRTVFKATSGEIPEEALQFNRALDRAVQLLAYRVAQHMRMKP